MTNKEIAAKILEYVGTEKNVKNLTHCVTRLRFVLKNEKLADVKKIEALEGVLSVQQQGGQFQVIVGSKVNRLYKELVGMVNISDEMPEETGKKKSVLTRVLETLSSILIPSLPPLIGGGMIKGFLFMFWEFGWIEWGSDIFNLLNIMSDCMFYFYPFLLAVSAAKRFKTNVYMALALAGTIMHPTIFEGINGGLANFKVFGFLKIPYLDYSSSVLPIILSVWIMSYVYRFLEDHIPEIVSIIFTPMLTLVVMVPLTLAGIAPLGFYTGEYIAKGVEALIDFSPIVAGFVIGAIRPITVFTGTHHAVRAIVSQQLATYGYTTIGAMNYMSTMAQAAAPLAIYFIVRKSNKKMRDVSLSAAVSGFLGVTEPGLYGIIVKYKVAFVATAIGGGIGAAISSAFGGAEYAMVMSSLVTIPATFGKGFIGIAIGLPVSILVTMAIIFLFKDKVLEEDRNMQGGEEPQEVIEKEDRIIRIASPVAGTLKVLKELPDKTFSEKIMGEGVALTPSSNTLYSPVNGTITAVVPTHHAIGITSDDGVELLIHIGVDTVKLNGKYFKSDVAQGTRVQAGDKLVEFDYEKIQAEGYNCDVIVLVTNTEDYLDVFPNTSLETAKVNDELLRIIDSRGEE